jgi:hypothetical protein
MRAITKFAAVAAAALSMAAFAAPSQAAIFIGIEQQGVDGDGAGPCTTGSICTVATGAQAAGFFGTFGDFEMEFVAGGEGTLPTLLTGNTQDHNFAGGGGTLDIYVTRTNLFGPPSNFRSTFTSNVLPAAWTITQTTYVNDNPLALYGGTQLSTHTFETIGTFQHTVANPGVTAGYSLTQRFHIVAPNTGSAQQTLAIHGVVPEASTWALMILGFGSAGAMLRRRRQMALAV